jgi:hypothetical protein
LISDTVVYSSSAAATAWTHGWVDLSSWRGQTVTVTFQAQNDLSKGLLTTFIDDVSVGSWLTPMIYSVEPERIEPNTPFVLIIKGENFVNRPMVRLNGIEYSQAQWKDEHTLQLTLASGLDGGIYEVEVSNPGGQETIWSRRIQVGSFIYLPIQMR